MELVGDTRKAIDECFAYDDITRVLGALETVQQQQPHLSKWAEKTSKTIRDRSPTSVKVTLKQMQLGKNWTIDHAFQREYHIASVFMDKHDFVEGVTAKLVRRQKERPDWQPNTLEEVDWKDVDEYFLLPKNQEQLQLLNQSPGSSFLTYPHAWIGLPTEEEVRGVVEGVRRTRKDAVRHFVKQREGKLGTRERVEEILARKTKIEDGTLVWDAVVEGLQTSRSQGSRDPNGPAL